ncbi:hypothetical protein SUGI_0026750 [Cryptomeria japonica]|nr:hypothetical protein SUGI_0026750 [Cryptomeria japonica]
MAKLSFHAHSLPDFHSYNHSLSAKPTSYSFRRAKLQRAKLTIRALNNTLERVSSPVMTLYDVLSVSQSVELSELKKAYREKVRVYHPDVCAPGEREESSKIFIQEECECEGWCQADMGRTT